MDFLSEVGVRLVDDYLIPFISFDFKFPIARLIKDVFSAVGCAYAQRTL